MSGHRARFALRPTHRWLVALTLVAFAAIAAVLLLRPKPHRPEPVTARNAVGDSTCLSCHGDKGSYEGTAHRLTSRHPTREAFVGSFRRGENVLRTPNPALHFRMDADSTGFHQTAVMGTPPDTTIRTERIAFVTGSGRKGQSFLYWAGDRLFQLPVSYWRSLNAWVNSPGEVYREGSMNFNRSIAPRCLECHATWIEPVQELTIVNRYQPDSVLLGITCERCHSAGPQHVANQRSALRAVRPPAILNPARLSRERQVEACAQCHGGLGSPIAPSFSYVAGQPLSRYLHLPPLPPDAKVDVHGNQVGMLARSACYQQSQMTCSTCHDVHRTQRDPVALSARCLTCHTSLPAGLVPAHEPAPPGNCVDCHMPVQTSNTLFSNVQGRQEFVRVRTHWIRVHPDSAARGGARSGTR